MRRLQSCHFNPRSPCGERHFDPELFLLNWQFQSTLPVRGATKEACACTTSTTISIHAPRAGSDPAAVLAYDGGRSFQSTLPVRGATTLWAATSCVPMDFNPRSPCGERRGCSENHVVNRYISIHAPRAGSDPARLVLRSVGCDFNPRSPCGERLDNHCVIWYNCCISIHAPRAGSDANAAAIL